MLGVQCGANACLAQARVGHRVKHPVALTLTLAVLLTFSQSADSTLLASAGWGAARGSRLAAALRARPLCISCLRDSSAALLGCCSPPVCARTAKLLRLLLTGATLEAVKAEKRE